VVAVVNQIRAYNNGKGRFIRSRDTDNIGVSRAVNGNRVAILIARAADVARIDQHCWVDGQWLRFVVGAYIKSEDAMLLRIGNGNFVRSLIGNGLVINKSADGSRHLHLARVIQREI